MFWFNTINKIHSTWNNAANTHNAIWNGHLIGMRKLANKLGGGFVAEVHELEGFLNAHARATAHYNREHARWVEACVLCFDGDVTASNAAGYAAANRETHPDLFETMRELNQIDRQLATCECNLTQAINDLTRRMSINFENSAFVLDTMSINTAEVETYTYLQAELTKVNEALRVNIGI